MDTPERRHKDKDTWPPPPSRRSPAEGTAGRGPGSVRSIILLCLSLVAPVAVTSLYLHYSRTHALGVDAGRADMVAWGLSLALGTAFTFFVPMRVPVRLLGLLLYVLVGGLLLLLYSACYVCGEFNACF